MEYTQVEELKRLLTNYFQSISISTPRYHHLSKENV
jgi:hypothetical protein